MTLAWFRAYGEMVDDAKLRVLAFEDRWHYVAVLCCKCQGLQDTTTPDRLDRLMGVKLGLAQRDLDEVRKRLMSEGLIDKKWQPQGWDKRQFATDSSTERTRKWREAQKELRTEQNRTDTYTEGDVTGNVTVTFAERFTEFQSLYPRRSGSQPWPRAEKAIQARLTDGATWQDIVAGVRRYGEFCRVTNKVGTEYVMQASTFCGPDKRYLEDWRPPATKADVRLNANLDAAAEFMRRTDATEGP
jgi:hypothetical protein